MQQGIHQSSGFVAVVSFHGDLMLDVDVNLDANVRSGFVHAFSLILMQQWIVKLSLKLNLSTCMQTFSTTMI